MASAQRRSSDRRRLVGARTGGVAVLLAAVVVGGAAAPAMASPRAAGRHLFPALRVVSVTPSKSATDVRPEATITVKFSAPLTPGTAIPLLDPAVAGKWSHTGSTMTFRPTGGFLPSTVETVTVPSDVTAKEGSRTVLLSRTYSTSFTVAPGSYRRVQQLLAELHYLPITFTPTAMIPKGHAEPANPLNEEPTHADAVATAPVPGMFKWEYKDMPPALAAQWLPGTDNTMTRGAIMTFEANHDLPVDGVASAAVWRALVEAVAARDVDPRPYYYIEVSENLPETLSVWQGGKIVFTSLANTGVPGAETAIGTFPIYTHLVSTMMSGTDVDGATYDVLVHYVGYFEGGDAVHGYPRASYGYPQSNGCVELPALAAEKIFNNHENYYGVLVTVSPPSS